MEIEINLEKEDWRRFQSHIEKELYKQKENWTDGFWVNLIVWAIMTALLMWAFDKFSDFHWPTAVFVLVIFVLITVLYFSKVFKLRKAFEPMESGTFCGSHKFTFTDEGIVSEGKGYQGSHSWEIVKKVDRAAGMVLVYLDTAYAYVFPEAKLANPDEFYEYVSWQSRKAADRPVAG